MPHEASPNDQKHNKLFLFDLLAKKQKFRSNLSRTTTSNYDLFNSIFKNESRRLFLDTKILNKLEAINSSILVSGYLRGKTNFSEEKKNYFILRKYNNEIRSKFLLECYKDSSFKKAKYIIDIDYVDQIDLKETENKIVLTRANEYCVLNAGDKRNAFIWLNKICKNCGFDEITNNKPEHASAQQVAKDLSKLIASTNNRSNTKLQTSANSFILENDSSIESKTNNANAHNISTSSNSNSSNSSSSNNNQIQNPNKPVAGIAALSVGSFHFKLDSLFKKKTSNQANISSKKTVKQKSLSEGDDIETQKENYVMLKECSSGPNTDNLKQSNTLLFNNYDDDIFYDSFNSLDNKQKSNTTKQSKSKENSNEPLLNQKLPNKLVKSTSYDNEEEKNSSILDKRFSAYYTNELNNRYINYTHRYDDQNDSHDVNNNNTQKLRYVPLEIIENSNVCYTRVYADEPAQTPTLTTNKYDTKKNSNRKNSILTSQDLNKEYTDWDAARTIALKNTQEEIQLLRMHKESVF